MERCYQNIAHSLQLSLFDTFATVLLSTVTYFNPAKYRIQLCGIESIYRRNLFMLISLFTLLVISNIEHIQKSVRMIVRMCNHIRMLVKIFVTTEELRIYRYNWALLLSTQCCFRMFLLEALKSVCRGYVCIFASVVVSKYLNSNNS